jgi:enoyl-[acyl-carrier protein] reductase II
MVSAEVLDEAKVMIDTAIRVREENPGMKDHFKVLFTSAGDPIPWRDQIKSSGFTWLHVVPSVKAAIRCRKAGVDCIVASGHEGGFHIAWEPVHSMVLLPAVIDAIADPNFPVVGAGGFCDGKTLAAALAMGAAGVQMGTRFLATQESDFHPLWKEQVVKTEDRGTLVARGVVGPARWLKTPSSVIHLHNSIVHSPGVFTGIPDDWTTAPPELLQYERDGIKAVCLGDREKALMAGGECAQRVADLPKVQDLMDSIMKEAVEIVRNMPRHLAAP